MNITVNAENAIKRNSIINGDCIHVMKQLPTASVDFILTDPPYLINYISRDGRKVRNDDNAAWLKPAYAEMFRVLAKDSFCISFYGHRHADKFIHAYTAAGFRIAGHFVFPKRYTSSTRFVREQHECAHLLVKGYAKEPAYPIGNVIDFAYSGNKLHPTQKPVSALYPLIDTFCKPKGLVLDPFAGSGSTLIAARGAGREFIGIELDSNYHAIAQQRLQAVS